MKPKYEFMAIMLIIFGLCFFISTLGYNESDPSIISIKVVRSGFPMTWLKTTTGSPPPPPTQYSVLWIELIIDIIFYLALSSAISFIIIRTRRKSENFVGSSQKFLISFFFIILTAYFTKLLTCGIHEFLGHGLWARVFGAQSIEVYVSWLGFGWCRWYPSNLGYAGNVMAMTGGVVNTLIIGIAVLAFLFLVPKKGGLYLRGFLFFLGFWAMTTQSSYLLLGGFAGEGDPWQLHLLTGIPLVFFAFLGFSLFLLFYPIISILFFPNVSRFFPEHSQKMLLFVLWLAMPSQVVLLAISSDGIFSFNVTSAMFLLLLAVSIVPSLLSLLFFKFFNRMQGTNSP